MSNFKEKIYFVLPLPASHSTHASLKSSGLYVYCILCDIVPERALQD